jgi:hypothetical protein
MQYIDIYSGTRNREKYPNPADFDVLIQHPYENGEIIDPISYETIIYPDTEDVGPLYYYTETLREPLGQLVEDTYLPYMYAVNSSNTDNTIELYLDELPLKSIDPTTDSVSPNNAYPRYAIPLGESNEYYTGKYLEDVLYNEFRLITSTRYDISNTFLQSATVLYTNQVGNAFYIFVSNSDTSELKLSDIPRYYQGKYLSVISGSSTGSKSLIINYIPDVLSSAIQVNSFISLSPGDKINIVSNASWYVSISSPFTNSVGVYPSYFTSSVTSFRFTIESIYSSTSSISKLSVNNNYLQGIGIAFIQANGTTNGSLQPLGDVYYLQSSENNGLSWFSETEIYTNAIISGNIGLNNTQGYIDSITPYLQMIVSLNTDFTIRASVGNANVYVNNNPPTIWTTESLPTALTAYGPTTPPDISANMSVTSYKNWNQQFITGVSTSTYQTMFNLTYVIFAENTVTLKYRVLINDTVLFSGTILTAATYVTPLASVIISTTNFLAIMYTADGATYYVISTTNNLSSLATDTKVNVSSTYLHASIIEAFSYDAKSLSIWGLSFAYYKKVSTQHYIYVMSTNGALLLEFEIALTQDPTKFIVRTEQTNIDLETPDCTIYVFYTNSIGLYVSSMDFSSLVQSTPILLDASIIIDMETVKTSLGIIIVIYSRINTDTGLYEIITLKFDDTDIIASTPRPYRIRDAPPTENGTIGSISNMTSNTFNLTLTSENPIGKYIYIYNANLYQLSNPYTVFNSTYKITNYDSLTSLVTISPSFDVDPSIYYPPIGSTTLFLDFTDPDDLGNDVSGNFYDFTPNSPNTNTIYNTFSTDVNNVTLYDVVRLTGGNPCGLYKDVIDLYELSKTFLTSAQQITNLSTGSKTILSSTFTISFWFKADNVSGLKTLVYFQGYLYPPATGNSYVDIQYFLSGSTLYVDFDVFTGAALSREIDLEVPGIVANTWYNVTHVREFNTPSVLYINGAIPSNLVVNTNTFVVLKKWFRFIQLGYKIQGSNQTRFTGYLKNFIMTDVFWDQQQVLNVYHNALRTTGYGLNWELFSVQENFIPLDVSLSKLPSTQPVCYEIELTHLILPNVELLTGGIGGILAFYSHVYVLFLPINETFSRNIIFSNTLTRGKLFKVPITNTSTPLQTNFVSNFSNMRQTIKFRSTDNFHFAVYMANGEIFLGNIPDNMPPYPPNAFVQVSATFGFRRVNKN